MKQIKMLLLTGMVMLFAATASMGDTLYEDAEDGNTDGWSIYDANPAGATITNIYDNDKASRVIQFAGSGTGNGYMLGGFEGTGTAWNNTQEKTIQWSMNYSGSYIIYVRTMTSNGKRLIRYTTSDSDGGLSGSHIIIGLGSDSNNGTWQTFTRDLEADLQAYEPGNDLLAVNAFMIRGSGMVDDIELLSGGEVPDTTPPVITLNGLNPMEVTQGDTFTDPGATAVDNVDGAVPVTESGTVDTSTIGSYTRTYTATDAAGNIQTETRTVNVVEAGQPSSGTLYEDAEDGNTDGWSIYDANPAGATITNIYDNDKASRVIQFAGSGTGNGYMLGGFEGTGTAWNNTQEKTIQWSMNYSGSYIIYVRTMTSNGKRLIRYTTSDSDGGLSGSHIIIGLGSDSNNGTWQTFTRDLEADLQAYEPGNDLLAVNAFMIRGSGMVDDIELLSGGEVPDTTPPVITLNGLNPMEVTQGDTFTDPGATAVDNVDGAVPVTESGTVDTSTIGSYTRTYTATDAAGNIQTETRTVNVVAASNTTPTASNFNISLDVNESIVIDDWKVRSSASDSDNDPLSASVMTNGSYGTCDVTEDFLSYSKTIETNATDTCLLGISDSTDTIQITVTIHSLFWKQISGGDWHTLAIKSDGTLWAWGLNDYGQLGDGTTVNRNSPVQIGTETNWVSVSGGGRHTIAIKIDGTLWAWGRNTYGQLGDGTTTDRHIPIQENTHGTNWISMTTGFDHIVAIKTNGTLWSWGRNTYGQLGDGTTTDRHIPIQESTAATDWDSVASGGWHTVAIKTDGTLWAWGRNTYGQLGNGTTNNKSSPTKLGTDTDWRSASASDYHTVATKIGGTLWALGRNHFGQLGDGTTSERHIPTLESTEATNWANVSASDYHTIVIQTDGTLWAWGQNTYGQLGDDTTDHHYDPTQEFTEAEDWSSMSTGDYHTIAIKSNGTLWAWGRNTYGQLGDGTTTVRHVPTQIIYGRN